MLNSCTEAAGDLEVDEEDGEWRVGDAPPGAPPAYRSAKSQRQADEQSDAELERQAPWQKKRNRYVDGVAKEGGEGEGGGDFF